MSDEKASCISAIRQADLLVDMKLAEIKTAGEMKPPRPGRVHVYAIVRLDIHQGFGENMDPDELARRVTVPKVVWNQEEAEQEVNRLNELNGPGSHYFWQVTRLCHTVSGG